MSSKSPVALVNFFVFNPTLGPREGEEHKKVLYYYPPDVDLDTKIRNVGLCEAISTFTKSFTESSCQSLHTQKHRQIFLQPEEDFWMVMTVSIPYSQKTKDGEAYTEYHEEDVQDSVYEAVLQQAYKMFKLFMGPMLYIVEKGGVHNLKQRLDHFFSRYLLTLKLNQSDILDVFNGLHFLPLDKNTYLRIQCFINLLEATFTQVQYTAFLYNDQLVWSGLEQDDMRIMYRYLTSNLLPTHMEQEFQGSTQAGFTNPAAPVGDSHYGKYITGPPNLQDESNLGKVPHVFVNTDVEIEECHLIVYKALSATVCLLLNGSLTLSLEYFRRLDKFLGPQVSGLASDISDQYSKRPSGSNEVQYKYVYFNHMNLAQKTTVHSDSKKTANISIAADTLKILSDINFDLSRVTPVEDGETIIKTCTDCWVVGKKSDQREFYVVINQKNANLIEINEEVKKLCTTHFNNIFFLD